MKQKVTNIICHYAEIGLKGKNRGFFEKKLANNIKKALNTRDIACDIKIASGSIIVSLSDNKEEAAKKAKQALKTVAGLHHFSFAVAVEPDLDQIKKTSLSLLEGVDFQSFKIDTKRSDKSYPMKSMEINKEVGAFIVERTSKDVKMDEPDVTIFIEIINTVKNNTKAFVFTDKNKGWGGLPVSSSGKALSLISGGIDSPVSSFLMNKRGASNEFIHFHSYPFTDRESIENVKDVIRILNKFQFNSEVHWVPFADIQKKIVASSPAPLRIVLYRRFMIRIASAIAKERNIPVLVSGDSVGQVGSQTLENILAISQVTSRPILRPLSGMDKEEIIKIAKQIGTFDTSIRPCEDTCSRFMPDHPTTKADLKKIRSAEEDLNVEKMVEDCVNQVELEQIREVRKDA